jgi:hypothetical protein
MIGADTGHATLTIECHAPDSLIATAPGDQVFFPSTADMVKTFPWVSFELGLLAGLQKILQGVHLCQTFHTRPHVLPDQQPPLHI